jgi:hypothetical protein
VRGPTYVVRGQGTSRCACGDCAGSSSHCRAQFVQTAALERVLAGSLCAAMVCTCSARGNMLWQVWMFWYLCCCRHWKWCLRACFRTMKAQTYPPLRASTCQLAHSSAPEIPARVITSLLPVITPVANNATTTDNSTQLLLVKQTQCTAAEGLGAGHSRSVQWNISRGS